MTLAFGKLAYIGLKAHVPYAFWSRPVNKEVAQWPL
jgi:hypothetical protein